MGLLPANFKDAKLAVDNFKVSCRKKLGPRAKYFFCFMFFTKILIVATFFLFAAPSSVSSGIKAAAAEQPVALLEASELGPMNVTERTLREGLPSEGQLNTLPPEKELTDPPAVVPEVVVEGSPEETPELVETTTWMPPQKAIYRFTSCPG
mmetsp:Transcript_60334/g.143746  ORF Transcript_60334/g.143746 Transcript_60334/m.143746 type:complete len:151 (-) Transcript_60334:420-872(-)